MDINEAIKSKDLAKETFPGEKFVIRRTHLTKFKVVHIIDSEHEEDYTLKPPRESTPERRILFCHMCNGQRLVKEYICCDCKTPMHEMDRRIGTDRRYR